jgi:hypothetical protein
MKFIGGDEFMDFDTVVIAIAKLRRVRKRSDKNSKGQGEEEEAEEEEKYSNSAFCISLKPTWNYYLDSKRERANLQSFEY